VVEEKVWVENKDWLDKHERTRRGRERKMKIKAQQAD